METGFSIGNLIQSATPALAAPSAQLGTHGSARLSAGTTSTGGGPIIEGNSQASFAQTLAASSHLSLDNEPNSSSASNPQIAASSAAPQKIVVLQLAANNRESAVTTAPSPAVPEMQPMKASTPTAQLSTSEAMVQPAADQSRLQLQHRLQPFVDKNSKQTDVEKQATVESAPQVTEPPVSSNKIAAAKSDDKASPTVSDTGKPAPLASNAEQEAPLPNVSALEVKPSATPAIQAETASAAVASTSTGKPVKTHAANNAKGDLAATGTDASAGVAGLAQPQQLVAGSTPAPLLATSAKATLASPGATPARQTNSTISAKQPGGPSDPQSSKGQTAIDHAASAAKGADATSAEASATQSGAGNVTPAVQVQAAVPATFHGVLVASSPVLATPSTTLQTVDLASVKATPTVSTTADQVTVLTTQTNGGFAGEHQTLTATPNVLEVGVASGSHGWLKVRAEMTDGTVTSSVTASSTSALAALNKELPGMAAYLAEQHTAIPSLALDHARVGNGADSSLSSSANAGNGAESQRGDNATPAGGSNVDSADDSITGASDALDNGLAGLGLTFAGAEPPTAYTTGSGSWLNVLA